MLKLNSSYVTLDDFGEELQRADSTPLKILIESHKFPESPYEVGTAKTSRFLS
jgi:hypothetical protein